MRAALSSTETNCLKFTQNIKKENGKINVYQNQQLKNIFFKADLGVFKKIAEQGEKGGKYPWQRIEASDDGGQRVFLQGLDELPSTPAIPQGALPFQNVEEERLVFKMSYLGITGGYATLIVRKPSGKAVGAKNIQHADLDDMQDVDTGDGSAVVSELRGISVDGENLLWRDGDENLYYFELSAITSPWVEKFYRLRMKMSSYADPSDFTTLRFFESKRERENVYLNYQIFDRETGSFYFFYKKNDEPSIVKNDTIAKIGLSVPSAFYFARLQDLQPGKVYYSRAAFRDTIMPIGVEVVKKKKVRTHYGFQNTIVIRPLMQFDGLLSEHRDMLIYLSDDKYRIPLVMEMKTGYGKFRGTLIEGYEIASDSQ